MATTDYFIERNISSYDEYFKDQDHLYPNENIVRLVKWFWEPGGRVLDYGFGFGENLIHLLTMGYGCEGIDVSKTALALVENKLKRYPEFEGKCNLSLLGARQDLPFADNHFDYILANQVIYFLASKEAVQKLLYEFQRVLKPGGKLIATMASQLNNYCSKGFEVKPDVYKYSEYGLDFWAYVLRDEGHAREVFSMFDIQEIGWFDNHYCGSAGHHFVILATNKKDRE